MFENELSRKENAKTALLKFITDLMINGISVVWKHKDERILASMLIDYDLQVINVISKGGQKPRSVYFKVCTLKRKPRLVHPTGDTIEIYAEFRCINCEPITTLTLQFANSSQALNFSNSLIVLNII